MLKWEAVHPQPDTYNFAPADRYVEFGERNGMFIVGHTLVWHSQTPRWVFEDASGAPITRDALFARMHDHIATVVGRYKGRIKGWDVVNEAVEEDGTMRQLAVVQRSSARTSSRRRSSSRMKRIPRPSCTTTTTRSRTRRSGTARWR